MKKTLQKKHYSGIIKQSISVNTQPGKAWSKISNIVGLTEWVNDVKRVTFLSKKRRGIGAKRNIIFNDGNQIEEHIVAWNEGTSFSYIALNGLPLRTYVATISVQKKSNKTNIIWESYVISKPTTQKKFNEFLSLMNQFYRESLKTLKEKLE